MHSKNVTVPLVVLLSLIFGVFSWFIFTQLYPQNLSQTLASNYYIYLIGNDESTWLHHAEHLKYSNQFTFYQGFHATFLYLFIDKSSSVLFLAKYILAFCSIYFLFSTLLRRKLLHVDLILLTFVVSSNPYFLLLHATTLRDDIIVSVVLFFSSLLLKLHLFRSSCNLSFNQLLSRRLLLFAFFALLFISLRPIYTLTILCFAFPVVLLSTFSLNSFLSKMFTYLFGLFLYIRFSSHFFESDFNFFSIFTNFRNMFFSPIPNFISTEYISQSCYGDFACFYQYAFIFTILNLLLFVWVFFNILIKRSFFTRFFVVEDLFVFLLSLALPYLINLSPYDISGPRQAFPVVVLAHILFLSLIINRKQSSF